MLNKTEWFVGPLATMCRTEQAVTYRLPRHVIAELEQAYSVRRLLLRAFRRTVGAPKEAAASAVT